MFFLSEETHEKESSFSKELDQSLQENPALSEFLRRSPEENIKLLDKESKKSKIYGYAYVRGDGQMREIPGMNQIAFVLPHDRNGGKYVGYESYEDTYKRAKAEYENAIILDKGDSNIGKKYQEALVLYDAKKIEYQNYLYQHSDCPDYLSDKINPAKAYADYIQQKEAKEALAKKEEGQATGDVSMQEIHEKGKSKDQFLVTSASEYKNSTSQRPEEYVVQLSGTLSSKTLEHMGAYAKAKNVSLSPITAEKGTDEYGKQVLSQMKEIDQSLRKENPEYLSLLPENTRYYQDGENPRAIPGMTLIVGKIEGAGGYYAGYESYEQTYRRSLSEYEKEKKQVEDVVDTDQWGDKTEALHQKYFDIQKTYALQKEQYKAYQKANPSGHYLEKSDPLQAVEDYDQENPWLKQFQNGFYDVWERCKAIGKNMGDTMRLYQLQSQGVDTNALYSEDEAVKVSSDYWAKRKENSPNDALAEQKSNEFSKLADKEDQKSPRQDDLLKIQRLGVGSATPYLAERENGEKREKKREHKGSTGNELLDSLATGHADAAIHQLIHQLPDDQGVEVLPSSRSKEIKRESSREASVKETANPSVPDSSQNYQMQLEKLAELEAKLNAAKEKESQLNF